MIRNPIDISSRVSPELSGLIEILGDKSDLGDALTLGAVRTFAVGKFREEADEDEHLDRLRIDESVIDELDELIEQFGESAAAMDFINTFASEPLTRVIEAVMDDENRETPPTLEDIHEAVSGGLGASLVGEGILEEDEDDMLISEIESLIEHYGPDAMAEDFLRYE